MMFKVVLVAIMFLACGQSVCSAQWRYGLPPYRNSPFDDGQDYSLQEQKEQERQRKLDIENAPIRQADEIAALRTEVKGLRSELTSIRELLGRLLSKPEIKPSAKSKEPSRERVKEWFRSNDSAPPASWYKNGDPWRNPTAEEMQEVLEPDDELIGGPS